MEKLTREEVLHVANLARIEISDEAPDQINLPVGCRFEPRCPDATEECKMVDHTLFERGEEHWSACIFD